MTTRGWWWKLAVGGRGAGWAIMALAAGWSASTSSAHADDTLRPEQLYVDNQHGDDAHPGSREQPFATIDRAVRELRPGTTLHVLPTPTPYPGDIRIENIHGTPGAPIVIDGHGSVVSGRRQLPPEAWAAEGEDIFSRPLPNNAWGMESHWEGGFPLVWFEGRAGRNVARRDELLAEAYFLHKNRAAGKDDPLHNTLYIKLPAGRTPADFEVESIAGGGGIYVAGNHVTVRNFVCEYGGSDGFSTHRNQGVVFENVEARYFMDQGMSHHGAEVVVRRAHFHHNAGCGIVDVYPEARVRYENCLIEDDTWRGGVEFHRGQFEMVDCVIRNNAKKALVVAKGATVTLRNCLLAGPGEQATAGISVDADSSLTLENCTLHNFRLGLSLLLTAGSRVAVHHNAFLNCQTHWSITLLTPEGGDTPDLPTVLVADGNAYQPGQFAWRTHTMADGQRQIRDQRFAPDVWAEFRQLAGVDAAAVDLGTEGLADSPLALPELAGRGLAGGDIGASLSPAAFDRR